MRYLSFVQSTCDLPFPIRSLFRLEEGRGAGVDGACLLLSANSHQPRARRGDDEKESRVSGLIKRSFSLAGHRTSVALEAEFWDTLAGIAAREGQTLSALVAATDAARAAERPLASALRVLALLDVKKTP